MFHHHFSRDKSQIASWCQTNRDFACQNSSCPMEYTRRRHLQLPVSGNPINTLVTLYVSGNPVNTLVTLDVSGNLSTLVTLDVSGNPVNTLVTLDVSGNPVNTLVTAPLFWQQHMQF